MNALELLKQDHQNVKKLLRSATETEDKSEQKRLFREIRTELETHARLEETIFYPAVQEHKELASMVFESLEGASTGENFAPRVGSGYAW